MTGLPGQSASGAAMHTGRTDVAAWRLECRPPMDAPHLHDGNVLLARLARLVRLGGGDRVRGSRSRLQGPGSRCTPELQGCRTRPWCGEPTARQQGSPPAPLKPVGSTSTAAAATSQHMHFNTRPHTSEARRRTTYLVPGPLLLLALAGHLLRQTLQGGHGLVMGAGPSPAIVPALLALPMLLVLPGPLPLASRGHTRRARTTAACVCAAPAGARARAGVPPVRCRAASRRPRVPACPWDCACAPAAAAVFLWQLPLPAMLWPSSCGHGLAGWDSRI